MVAGRRILVVLGLTAALGLAATAAGAAPIIRLFGDDNVGTAGAQFLRIPVGARAVGMGNAYSALATDGAAPFWNPAGIMRTPGRSNYFFSHTEYTAGINLEHAAFHWRRQNFGFGLAAGVLNSGDILRTTEYHQNGTGQYFNANQFFVQGTIARAMTDRFSIGGNVKFYQENLDQYRMQGVFLDLGILYFLGMGDLRVGFSVLNFGGEIDPSGTPPAMADGYVPADTWQKFPAPTVGMFGVAKTWTFSERVGLLTSADFSHPSDYKESFRFGGELGLRRMLFVRAGFETSRSEGGFAAGFGVQLNRKQLQLRFDYAYQDLGSFGTIHRFTLDLSPLYRSKRTDSFVGDRR